MEINTTMYGIDRAYWQIILRILHQHAHQIQWVKLFGSRARGTARKTSDIDLAVSGEESAICQLAAEFEESSLPYSFDIIDYNRQSNEHLRQAIEKEGKLLFTTTEGGRAQMTKMQLQWKSRDYHQALSRLQSALSKELDADDMYLDATIQRFEFCFELAWKLMKHVLDYEGMEAKSPRECIREGWKQGFFENAEQWLDMLEKRNLSAHTYNESTALELYRHIKEVYVRLLADWDAEAHRRIERN